MSYSFTSTDITSALCSALKRGVDVEILVDKGVAKQKKALRELNEVIECKGRVYVDTSGVAIAHNKVMMIDNTTLTTGSVNWSYSGFKRNAENILFVYNSSIFYDYMNNYLNRLKNSTPLHKVLFEFYMNCSGTDTD